MKTKILKHLLIVIIITVTVFIYFNCSDDTATNPTNTSFTLSGQISGWTLSTKTLSAHIQSVSNHNYEIANCPIDSKGNFSLTLPATISDTTMYSGDSVFSMGCNGNVTINPSSSKGSKIWRLNVMDGSNVIGYIRCCNYDNLAPGAFEEVYLFVNQNLSVSGTQFCFQGDTIMYSGSATSGWNKVIENYVRQFSTGYVILYNNTEPSGAV